MLKLSLPDWNHHLERGGQSMLQTFWSDSNEVQGTQKSFEYQSMRRPFNCFNCFPKYIIPNQSIIKLMTQPEHHRLYGAGFRNFFLLQSTLWIPHYFPVNGEPWKFKVRAFPPVSFKKRSAFNLKNQSLGSLFSSERFDVFMKKMKIWFDSFNSKFNSI